MFLINTINITDESEPLNCKLYFDWGGIQIIYKTKTDFISKSNIKNITLDNDITKKGKKNYLKIENYKIYLTCNINDKLQKLTFLAFENCENIIQWLKKNYRRDEI